jgi:hypothetical protein
MRKVMLYALAFLVSAAVTPAAMAATKGKGKVHARVHRSASAPSAMTKRKKATGDKLSNPAPTGRSLRKEAQSAEPTAASPAGKARVKKHKSKV